jgi:hypothetical protein
MQLQIKVQYFWKRILLEVGKFAIKLGYMGF